MLLFCGDLLNFVLYVELVTEVSTVGTVIQLSEELVCHFLCLCRCKHLKIL